MVWKCHFLTQLRIGQLIDLFQHTVPPPQRKKEYKLNNPPDLSAYPVENCIPKHAFEVEHVENRKKSNFTFLMHQNYSLNIMSVYGMSICSFRQRALSFYGSKIILDHLNHFGPSKSFWTVQIILVEHHSFWLVQFILVWSKSFWTGPNYKN